MTTKQDDVNYDDVQMEMSDDDDDEDHTSDESDSSEDVDTSKAHDKSKKPEKEEKEMFSNDGDYRAYKSQFGSSSSSSSSSNKNKKVERTKSSDYGTSERGEETSEYGGVRHEVRPAISIEQSEKLKRLRQLSNEDFSAVVKEADESCSDLKKVKKNFDRREKSSEHHSSDDRRHRREKSRSASRERKRSKKDRRDDRRRRDRSRSRSRDRHQRRHRSRSSSRERRQHRQQLQQQQQQHHRDDHPRFDKRQELRNRKLVALGLTQAVSSDRQLPTAAGMAAAMGNNYSGPDQVEAQLAHVKAVTGVDLPKYYNPTAINPLKFAEQIKKRQMLWGTKKPESNESAAPEAANHQPVVQEGSSSQQPQHQGGSFNKWESTNFGNSQANEKFRRLMGIKSGAQPQPDAQVSNTTDTHKMFAEQEMEYERARAITHTQRGLGLGFASAPATFKNDPNVSGPKPSTAGISFVKK